MEPISRTDHDIETADGQDQVVSRHLTSEGVLVYLRTASGALRARLLHWSGDAKTLVGGGRDVGPDARRPRLRAC